jgi:prolycopene isomerase
LRHHTETVLRDRYDVVVVGAGLGGMTAASLLAKRELSVLMIEQQSKPGGSCTSFKREDCVFDVGTAMIYGFGEKGFRPFRFLMNELEEPIEIVAHRTLARMTFEGQEIVFWPDVDRFLEELYRLFPEEKAGLRAFYSDLYKLYENIVIKNEVIVPPSEFSPRQGLRRLLSDPLGIWRMQKLLSTSTRDLLEHYFHTEGIFTFFDKLCSAYCYTTAAETPAVLAATMFLDNHIGGVYFPAGGAQMLPNKIERGFERYGGRVLYSCLVDEILIREGRAYGVRLEDGREILADRVVANATVWNIYGKLVRPEHIAPERLAWVRSLVPTYPSMTLYMVVDPAAVPEGAFPWEIFIENRKVIDSSDLTLYINSLVDKTLCPEGKLVVMAISPNLNRWPSPTDPDYRSPTYLAHKENEAEGMVDQIEQHFPGFRRHIQTLIIGTPSTIERYLLKNGGAVGGPKNMIGQEMLKRLHARSEWKNLYFCGDSTVMSTGAPATVVSGVGAANMVLRDLRKEEYDTRRYSRQYVHFVDLPYRRHRPLPDEALSLETVPLLAAECQWCEEPACQVGCPAGIDVPGFLRRMEAQNYAGAARLLRQRNPFAEVCGFTCGPDAGCQSVCFRRSFAGRPVRVDELQRWVCRTAGAEGWPPPISRPRGRQVAVVGTSVTGLTCAYYLGLMGCRVDLYDQAELPGSRLLQTLLSLSVPQDTIERDLKGVLAHHIHFEGGSGVGGSQDLRRHLQSGDPTYLALAPTDDSARHLTEVLGEHWLQAVDAGTRQGAGSPGAFVSSAYLETEQSVVAMVAEGRRVALEIFQFLGAAIHSPVRESGNSPRAAPGSRG